MSHQKNEREQPRDEHSIMTGSQVSIFVHAHLYVLVTCHSHSNILRRIDINLQFMADFEASSSSSDSDGRVVARSSLTGRKLKLAVDKTREDRARDLQRQQYLSHLNAVND